MDQRQGLPEGEELTAPRLGSNRRGPPKIWPTSNNQRSKENPTTPTRWDADGPEYSARKRRELCRRPGAGFDSRSSEGCLRGVGFDRGPSPCFAGSDRGSLPRVGKESSPRPKSKPSRREPADEAIQLSSRKAARVFSKALSQLKWRRAASIASTLSDKLEVRCVGCIPSRIPNCDQPV